MCWLRAPDREGCWLRPRGYSGIPLLVQRPERGRRVVLAGARLWPGWLPEPGSDAGQRGAKGRLRTILESQHVLSSLPTANINRVSCICDGGLLPRSRESCRPDRCRLPARRALAGAARPKLRCAVNGGDEYAARPPSCPA